MTKLFALDIVLVDRGIPEMASSKDVIYLRIEC